MDIQQINQSVVSNPVPVITPSSVGSSEAVQVKVPTEQTQQVLGNSEKRAPEDLQIVRQSTGVAERVLIDAIEKANKKLYGESAEYSFSVHEATKQIMIKVVDKDTGDIIKEIPSEKALDAVAKMWELVGLFVDEKR